MILTTSTTCTDLSTGSPTSWNWSFGNGVYNTSQNVTYEYPASGTYDVSLTASNYGGSNTSTRAGYITVTPLVVERRFFNTTGNSSWIAPYGVTSIHLLVVGGGGGGAAPAGGAGGGGGGAGGVIDTTYSVASGETYNVYVGAGGTAGSTTGATPTRGSNTSFNNATASQIAYGGGRGDTTGGLLSNGSSGGGSRLAPFGYAVYGSQGYNGYATGQTSSPFTAGGGGGFGGASTSQVGGACYNLTWVTGNTTSLAAGGGGGTYAGANTVSMCGVGGIGAQNSGQTAGVANTGSGGGGYGGTNTATAGAGASGTVIIVYDEQPLSSMFTTNYTTPLVSPPTRPVQFTDQSPGSPTAWSWSFRNSTGNNTVVQFSTIQNPVYSFGVGNFSIALNASTSLAYVHSTQNTWINISALPDVPIPSFTSTTPTGIVPLTIVFTDTSANYPTSWNWSFGDGYLSTSQNPTHTYNTAGTYSINLTESSPAGSNSTVFTNYVTVNPMVASFSANITYAPIPMGVGFTGSSTGSPNTWYWEFGDGTNSTLQNPSHLYTVTGIYNVNFRATNTSSGAYDWENKTAYINAFELTPVADFSAVPVTGTVPTSVVFTDLSTNSPTSWNWSFGDGYVSSSRNVTHVYNTAGTYTVNLTANNTAGSNSMVKTNYITINPMVASFSADHTTGAFSVVAQFTGSSTGTPNTWYWDLGDGNTSTLQNPLHTYSTVGTYDVKMKATNNSSGAFDWENKTGYIILTGYQAPVASFTISASDSYVPMTVVFGDTSTNSPYAWNWSFGDGNLSALQNPTHIYTVPGSYTVTLNATNAVGSNTSSFSYIHASAIPLAPTVNFSWSNTQGITLPVTVQFTDLSTQSPTSWYWSDFGDGSGQTSLLQNPTHVYNNVGAFPVTLSVTNVNGTPSQTTKYVQVTSTTGGVTSSKTTVGTQTIETLSGSGTYAWTCPSGVYSVETLLVGGGAAGTNGGTVTGKTNVWSPSGGQQGTSISQPSISVTPGNVYQFVVGEGGTSANTSVTYTSIGGVWNLLRNGNIYGTWTDATGATYLTPDPLYGGYTYAFGYTANGGTNGLQYIRPYYETQTYATGSVFSTGANGNTYSTSGVYVTYGGSGGGSTYAGGVQGGGNGYNYLGGPSTPGAFYGAGGGAGDTTGGSTDSGKAGYNGVIILNYQVSSVILPPVANFTGTPTSGYAPLSVQFTDYSTNGPTSWSWSFGDGGSSTEKNPSHTYTSPGTYTVALTDYNSNTTASGNFVRTNYINVSGPEPTPTPAPQSSTTWYVPRTITMHVVNSASNQIVGAQVSAVYNSSTLPGGAAELINFYGMNQQAANNAVNGTLIMSGTTDSNGDVVFTMLSTLKYDLTVTYEGTTNTFSIHPQDSYYQLRFLKSTAADTDISTCLYANGNTHISASQPDPYNFTMSWSYQDTCGLTTALDYYVFKDIQNAPSQMIYYYHLTPVTSGIYVNNYTVPNVRGDEYRWYENFTRSV